jgi:hypothetical protein
LVVPGFPAIISVMYASPCRFPESNFKYANLI